MEMAICVFAVVLFSSVSLLINRTLLVQHDLETNVNQYMQASHLNHSILDEVDAKLFSKQLKFSNISSTYNLSRTHTLAHTGGAWVSSITAVQCDSLGIPLQVADPTNIYMLVKVSTNAAGLKHPVNSFRVYTKTHLNL
jgi:hypothetical protein